MSLPAAGTFKMTDYPQYEALAVICSAPLGARREATEDLHTLDELTRHIVRSARDAQAIYAKLGVASERRTTLGSASGSFDVASTVHSEIDWLELTAEAAAYCRAYADLLLGDPQEAVREMLKASVS